MKKAILLSLLIGFSLVAVNASAQSEKKLLRKGRLQLSKGNYDHAKSLYGDLLRKVPNNPEYLFETGLAYYNSKVEKEKSVKYFENALKNSGDSKIGEIHYYLGKSYQYVGRNDDAIAQFNLFQDYVSASKSSIILQRDIDREIMMSNYAKQYESKAQLLKIENLGGNINTRYPDYASVVKADESTIYLTSRAPLNVGGKNSNDNKAFEDIFTSYSTDGGKTWSKRSSANRDIMFSNMNKNSHDAAINLSINEQKLYVYRDEDIYVSDLDDKGRWTKPKRLEGGNINSKYYEPSVFVTEDEQTLYFTSNRKGGFGGRDLYVSKKQTDGTWGTATNLGATINTELNEDAPYISSDGSLYFSSQGHSTMGGYDIFKSSPNGNGWSTPENLGIPLNSPGDDIYYKQLKDSKFAYFSSERIGGYGDMDIYKILLEPKNLKETTVKSKLMANTIGSDEMTPLMATVMVSDATTGETFGPYKTDENGNLNMTLVPDATYNVKYVFSNDSLYEPIKKVVTVPKQTKVYDNYIEMQIRNALNNKGNIYAQENCLVAAFFDIDRERGNTSKTDYLNDPSNSGAVTKDCETVEKNNNANVMGKLESKVENIYFDYDRSSLRAKSIEVMDRIIEYLKVNPAASIEVGGHTDNKGTDQYNMNLSKRRSDSAYNYFRKNGISANRISKSWHGESKPVVPNINPDGSDSPNNRQLNRRVMFKVNTGEDTSYLLNFVD